MKTNQTIADKVSLAREQLSKMDRSEKRDWAIAMGMDSAAGFSRFKKALTTIGLQYNPDQPNELPTPKFKVEFYSDFKQSRDKFAITDVQGNALWYGKCFENYEQSDGELDAATKAIWLAGKVRESLGVESLRLKLYVDAQWLLYNYASHQKGYKTRWLAKKHGIDLILEWTSGRTNKADGWTTAMGFKKWTDNDLPSLASPVDQVALEAGQ